jgi:hypothetical protein
MHAGEASYELEYFNINFVSDTFLGTIRCFSTQFLFSESAILGVVPVTPSTNEAVPSYLV